MVPSLTAVREKQGWRQLASTCLLRWHLCSLDAPTVAIVWALALARRGAVRLHAAEVLVLGLGTWIVYVLDRVLDGTVLHLGPEAKRFNQDSRPESFRVQLQARHHFHIRHRQFLLRLCCVACAALGLLCCRLPSRLVLFYLLLGVPVAAYGAWVHRQFLCKRRAVGMSIGRGKEAAVAVLFTAAVAAPTLHAVKPASRPGLLSAALLLALLCWLNCALISYAEAPLQSERSRERRLLIGGALGLAGMAAVVWGWGQASFLGRQGLSIGGPPSFAAAVLLSSLLLLGLLLSMRDAVAGTRRFRVLADLGLLTPLLFMLPPLWR